MNMPLNTSANTSDPIEQARYNMIEQQIRTWNVFDNDVRETLAAVHREDFAPQAYRSLAFVDMEIPLRGNPEEAMRNGQCMLKPNVEARLLQDLKVQKNERVLEIGTGSGHMAAMLAHQANQVVSLEIVPELATQARQNLQRAGVQNATVLLGDGAGSSLPEGPFDVILLSGSVAEVPKALLAQLSDGGRLAAIVGQEPVMRATFVRRNGDRFDTTQPWDVNAPRLVHFAEPSAFKF
jgi:protein-L-isoaspartate(D-aspartate) O-methyltransferase